MSRKSEKKIGEFILEAGLATALDIDHALQSQHVFGGLMGTNLVEMGILNADTLAAFLSTQFSVPVANKKDFDNVTSDTLALIPPTAAARLSILPLHYDDTNLYLAMSDPSEQRVISRIEGNIQKKIKAKVVSELVLRQYLEKYYGIARSSRYIKLSDQQQKLEHSELHDMDLENRMLDQHISAFLQTEDAVQHYFQYIKSLHKVPVIQKNKNIKDYDVNPGLTYLMTQIDGILSLQDLMGISIFSKITTLKALCYLHKLSIVAFENH
ncbi:MAG: hypothetical protein KDD52_01980 [Bdellovibrionales bacterium]|nr:hypothetical protein [Bdellovibrionales bacterium]